MNFLVYYTKPYLFSQAGIVVQGLESLTGSEPDKGEEEYDSMVGMASTMMGVKLRPLTFFRGYSDMMSLIWAGSSGDPSGVEAMILLIDHLQVILICVLHGCYNISQKINHFNILNPINTTQHIPMASGLRVKAEVLSAISTKITAEIGFSLWSRTVEIITTNG